MLLFFQAFEGRTEEFLLATVNCKHYKPHPVAARSHFICRTWDTFYTIISCYQFLITDPMHFKQGHLIPRKQLWVILLWQDKHWRLTRNSAISQVHPPPSSNELHQKEIKFKCITQFCLKRTISIYFLEISNYIGKKSDRPPESLK